MILLIVGNELDILGDFDFDLLFGGRLFLDKRLHASMFVPELDDFVFEPGQDDQFLIPPLNQTVQAHGKGSHHQQHYSVGNDFPQAGLFRVVDVNQVLSSQLAVLVVECFMSQQLVPKLAS